MRRNDRDNRNRRLTCTMLLVVGTLLLGGCVAPNYTWVHPDESGGGYYSGNDYYNDYGSAVPYYPGYGCGYYDCGYGYYPPSFTWSLGIGLGWPGYYGGWPYYYGYPYGGYYGYGWRYNQHHHHPRPTTPQPPLVSDDAPIPHRRGVNRKDARAISGRPGARDFPARRPPLRLEADDFAWRRGPSSPHGFNPAPARIERFPVMTRSPRPHGFNRAPVSQNTHAPVMHPGRAVMSSPPPPPPSSPARVSSPRNQEHPIL